jgi:hypothetical protein
MENEHKYIIRYTSLWERMLLDSRKPTLAEQRQEEYLSKRGSVLKTKKSLSSSFEERILSYR